jgi:site-specific recombinase XerD
MTTTHRSTNTYKLEGKGRKEETTQKNSQAQHFIKAKYSQEVQSSLIVSRAKYERVFYINSKERKLQEKANSMPPQQKAPWQ